MPQFIDYLGTSQIRIIVLLIGADVILGIVGAFAKKEFRLGKLAGFMKKGVIAYVLGFALLEMVAKVLPQLAFAVQIAFFLIVIALVSSLVRNLHKLGLPLPGKDWV